MQTRPIDAFVNVLQPIVSSTLPQDKKAQFGALQNEFKKLVAIVNFNEKKVPIQINPDLLELKRTLQSQIDTADDSYEEVKAKFQADLDSINDAVRQIDVRVQQAISGGELIEITDIAIISKLNIQVGQMQEDIEEQKEDQCCSFLAFCCPSKKINNEQAKVALLEEKQNKIKPGDQKAQTENHVNKLNFTKTKLLDEKERLNKNPPKKPSEELKIEIKEVEIEIDQNTLKQQQKLNSVCLKTMLQMFAVYEAYAAYLPTLAMDRLIPMMENIACRDVDYQMAAEIYRSQMIAVNASPAIPRVAV